MSLQSSDLSGNNKYVGNGTSLEQLRGQQNPHPQMMGPGPGGPQGAPPPQILQQQPEEQYYQQMMPPPPQEQHYYPQQMQMPQQAQVKAQDTKKISNACIPYTDVKWVVFVAVIFLFILLSNASIYKLESQFVPINFLSDDDPPIVLVIFNAILFGILFLVIHKLVSA